MLPTTCANHKHITWQLVPPVGLSRSGVDRPWFFRDARQPRNLVPISHGAAVYSIGTVLHTTEYKSSLTVIQYHLRVIDVVHDHRLEVSRSDVLFEL